MNIKDAKAILKEINLELEEGEYPEDLIISQQLPVAGIKVRQNNKISIK